ncbi:hypothetical protein K7957_18605 [Sphingomonas yunnanensis]|uniref:hypothetical protein n=1 Tax=Sphingomonas yunnanensis TaxID=310400 RepID=UPI001CA5FE2C|nr:hypothetical protein [Sphingomonas yunnanensis]MBY9064951.1 hypothetical protein [Sphingomonas yunnanensis]
MPKPTSSTGQDPLSYYTSRTVEELTRIENNDVSAEQAERHCIYSRLVFAIVADAFNGNKKGPNGTYPGRVGQSSRARDQACVAPAHIY